MFYELDEICNICIVYFTTRKQTFQQQNFTSSQDLRGFSLMLSKLPWHCLWDRVFTARKRSLGQGNMLTGVCLSTGGCLLWGGACSQGVWSGVPGPGGTWSRGLVLGGLVWGVPGLGGYLVPGGCLVLGGAWSQGGAWSWGVLGCGGFWF